MNVTVPAGTPLGQIFPEYSVKVTDDNGCVGTSTNSAVVKVTANPAFIFRSVAGDTTREYSTTTDAGLTYDWIIGTKCYTGDTLVYVEYDIYFKDENETDYTSIPNAQIGQYLKTQNYTNLYGVQKQFVTSNTFHWLNGDGSDNVNTSYYNYSIANPSVASQGNHFPNTGLGLTNTNVYDDLWLHFIGDRPVTMTFVPFKKHGEYKVVYRLYSTSHTDPFMHLYTEDNPNHTTAWNNYLGGQNAFMGTLDLLAIDSVHIVVTGEDVNTSTEPDFTPDVAPALTIDEETVTPDMEVWPNPAPAVTTTLKARVHNMNGNATVTLTNLMGKQVYSGNTYIDNDNYYFEFNVNSLAVGSYVLTVRTATDVITKKVIITALAR